MALKRSKKGETKGLEMFTGYDGERKSGLVGELLEWL
jgi:hypothetical protein